jgi:hypothetical protein
MPSSKPRKRNARGEVMPPLSVLEHVDNWLKKMLDYHPAKGSLSESEIEDWHRDLSPFPVEAIDYSFEAYRRNGGKFPVPRDILDVCVTWAPEPKYKPGCSRECTARHGKGYSEVDVKKLWELYTSKIGQLPNRPLTDTEVDQLLDELDRWRGKSPAWRVA